MKIILMIKALIIIFIFCSCQEQVKQVTANILPVETYIVKLSNSYQITRFYTGKLHPKENSSLSFEQPGTLASFFVKKGERVKKNAPLAQLNTKFLEVKREILFAQRDAEVAKLEELNNGARAEEFAIAQANINSLRALSQQANKELTRNNKLYKQKTISIGELDKSVFSQQALKAQLEAAQHQLLLLSNGTRKEKISIQKAVVKQIEARIKQLDVEIEKSLIKSPHAGIITSRYVEKGTAITIAQPVIRVTNDKIVEAHIGLPVQLANKYKTGSKGFLQIATKKFTATVSYIQPELNPDTLTVTVVFLVKSAQKLYFGEIVSLQVNKTIKHQGYWLPITALSKGKRSTWSCFVAVENFTGKWIAEKRAINIIDIKNTQVFVEGDIFSDERIISSGTQRIVSGQQILLKRQKQ